MRHIVFGGSGFTGAQLVRTLLQRGEDVLSVDLHGGTPAQAGGARHVTIDITDRNALEGLALGPEDTVYQLAARQYHLPVPKAGQDAFFQLVNTDGTRHILDRMLRRNCRRLVFFSTDMVYGIPQSIPVTTAHRRNPLGPYGRSKALAEDLCFDARRQGMNVTIFRPRLIVGPGRLGVLAKLFRLIRKGLPVPMIGDGSNRYQMVSVFDCVTAALAAAGAGVPNAEFNLGSDSPPSVRALLERLVSEVGSTSRVIATPGPAVKAVLAALESLGLPLMYKEQYGIADINYLVDIEATKRELDWRPRFGDFEMMAAAYREFVGSP